MSPTQSIRAKSIGTSRDRFHPALRRACDGLLNKLLSGETPMLYWKLQGEELHLT